MSIDVKWQIDKDALQALQRAWQEKKTFPNPYRLAGYGISVAALHSLGNDQWHGFDPFVAAFEKHADKEWLKAFKAKDGGMSYKERLHQNLQTLQRVNDYAYKLFQAGKQVLGTAGMVVDLRKSDKGIEIRLNTNGDTPLKISNRGTGKPRAPRTPKAPKVAKAPKAPKAPKVREITSRTVTEKDIKAAVQRAKAPDDKPPILSGRDALDFLMGRKK